jgi:glutamate N-acetyltransferase/amino-acid N-acetyltransferase
VAVSDGVCAPKGFVAGGAACGIKGDGVPDLAVVATEDRTAVPAAGVFTTNRACAAPVQISRTHLADGHAAAVVLSSGNANAATGERGRTDALRMAALTGAALGVAAEHVLVCSTGLIGYVLPMEPLESGIPALCADLNGATAAADAILTTDTVRKEAVAEVLGTAGLVGGMAKGAAMLSPAMATMLAVVTTDVAIDPTTLQEALLAATSDTFGALLVDGSMSTNDTVVVLANGRSGVDATEHVATFTDALTDVCGSLAEQMARDAEGAVKLVRLHVTGAASYEDARRAARQVAGSQLVQCSFNGEDPYWGRVLSELGASGAEFDPERVRIAYGGITVCHDGVEARDPAVADALGAVMAAEEIDLVCDLQAGDASARMLFTDLSHAYIDENRTTS